MNGAERIAAVRRSERAAITLRQSYLTELNRMFPGERKRPEVQRNPEFLELRRQIMKGDYGAIIERASQVDRDDPFADPKYEDSIWPGFAR